MRYPCTACGGRGPHTGPGHAYTTEEVPGQEASTLTEPSAKLLSDMLDREESWAADYHDSEADWLDWAGRIDGLRAEGGLPLLERGSDSKPMTYRASVEAHIARHADPEDS